MFTAIARISEHDLCSYADTFKDRLVNISMEDATFELQYIHRILAHANRLMENIDDNPLTHIIKRQLLKVISLLIRATNTKLDNLIDSIYTSLTGSSLNATSEMKLINNSHLSEYTIALRQSCLPRTILTQIGGIPASCGLHAVMHALQSMGFASNFIDFTNLSHQRAFAHGFNKLNDGKICTVMSEINDVLRSFADMIGLFIPPAKLYSCIGTKGTNDYNICDILKPSIKINAALKGSISSYTSTMNRTTEMSLKESVIYDIDKLHPEWVLFDIGMWCCIASGLNIDITIGSVQYRLHSFIANTGMHYVCCVLDIIQTERGPVNVVRVYDDMSNGMVQTASLTGFPLDCIGGMVFHKVSH